VFLEAMACGLPIVCYDRGGQTDFLVSGETGFVVKLNDIGAFTHAVHSVHADIYLRRRCGQRNRQLVESYFIDSCAARYEQTFETAIDKHLAAERNVASSAP
jgi:glycosyltransferase involved in cell wall biosynthesis